MPFPKLKIRNDGIYFNSTKRHRLKIGCAKIMQVGTKVYMQQDKIYITIQNIDKVFVRDGYIYFKGLGEVKILCNMRPIKRYFALRIESNKIEVSNMQNKAKNAIINHLFNMNECVELREYLTLISKVLNIKVNAEKIVVRKNKYNIPFTLYYRVNNVIKKINIQEI